MSTSFIQKRCLHKLQWPVVIPVCSLDLQFPRHGSTLDYLQTVVSSHRAMYFWWKCSFICSVITGRAGLLEGWDLDYHKLATFFDSLSAKRFPFEFQCPLILLRMTTFPWQLRLVIEGILVLARKLYNFCPMSAMLAYNVPLRYFFRSSCYASSELWYKLEDLQVRPILFCNALFRYCWAILYIQWLKTWNSF